jgi:uncharacterized protein (TIGR03118 family)
MILNNLCRWIVRRDRRDASRKSRQRSATLQKPSTALRVETLEERALMATAQFNAYRETNLISDQPSVAVIQDNKLVNAWGLAVSPTHGNFWIGDNATGAASVYTGDVQHGALSKASPDITVPGGDVTGVAYNRTSAFAINDGNGHHAPATFVFATEDGHIGGWSANIPPPAPSTVAHTGVTVDSAVYKGLTIGNNGSQNLIYAANFHGGTIDVFDKNFAAKQLKGQFTDPTLPAGYAPFNVQNISGTIYVTYAKQDALKHDEVDGAGLGFVDRFDTNGKYLGRLASGGSLNAPWGIVRAPTNFGAFGGDILVGNFGDGHINAFRYSTGAFDGTLADNSGNAIVIDGLWGLAFGNGSGAGDRGALYFTAGPSAESHGLFGKLTAAPKVLTSIHVSGPSSVSTNFSTADFAGTLHLRNSSSSTVLGPLNLVFGDLPADVTILNQTGTTADGLPFVTIGSSIAKHHTIDVRVLFHGSRSTLAAAKAALRQATVIQGDLIQG